MSQGAGHEAESAAAGDDASRRDPASPGGVPFEDWPYEQLREAAFDRALRHLDVGFFIDLMAHTPALTATADEGGSLGEIGGSLIETFEAAREAFSRDVQDELEPMFRAVFATYLREHPRRAGSRGAGHTEQSRNTEQSKNTEGADQAAAEDQGG